MTERLRGQDRVPQLNVKRISLPGEQEVRLVTMHLYPDIRADRRRAMAGMTKVYSNTPEWKREGRALAMHDFRESISPEIRYMRSVLAKLKMRWRGGGGLGGSALRWGSSPRWKKKADFPIEERMKHSAWKWSFLGNLETLRHMGAHGAKSGGEPQPLFTVQVAVSGAVGKEKILGYTTSQSADGIGLLEYLEDFATPGLSKAMMGNLERQLRRQGIDVLTTEIHPRASHLLREHYNLGFTHYTDKYWDLSPGVKFKSWGPGRVEEWKKANPQLVLLYKRLRGRGGFTAEQMNDVRWRMVRRLQDVSEDDTNVATLLWGGARPRNLRNYLRRRGY
ncbi:MAG TPA: hypothetical protein VJI13_00845 [Candidatus Norongarragalinales archaeon]|nr:hypothetical protein [Candidatus Norongarragalinales archaeon]